MLEVYETFILKLSVLSNMFWANNINSLISWRNPSNINSIELQEVQKKVKQ